MSWIDNLFGSEDDQNKESSNSISDKDIALDMLLDSKNDINMLTNAIAEAINPEVREFLRNRLNICVNEHFRLSDLSVSKDWYPAYSDAQQQIKKTSLEAENLINENNQ